MQYSQPLCVFLRGTYVQCFPSNTCVTNVVLTSTSTVVTAPPLLQPQLTKHGGVVSKAPGKTGCLQTGQAGVEEESDHRQGPAVCRRCALWLQGKGLASGGGVGHAILLQLSRWTSCSSTAGLGRSRGCVATLSLAVLFRRTVALAVLVAAFVALVHCCLARQKALN